MTKKIMSFLLACFLVFSLAACGGKDGSNDQTSTGLATGDTIKVGFIGPQTGDVAVYGLSTKQGVDLAIAEVNAAGGVLGKQLELIGEDDKGDPTESVTIYNKLMSQGVSAIIGAVTSKPSDAVAANSVEDGIPVITPTGTMSSITEGRDNVFRACYIDPYQGEILAAFAAENLKVKTAAVLRNTSDDYSNGVADAFIAKAKELGIEIVGDEGYGKTDVDFAVQLTNIAKNNPELLLVPEYYEKDVLIAKQAKELGIKAQIIGPDGWDGVLDVVDQDSLDSIEGIYFANHYSIDDESETVQSFIGKYREKYNDDPSAFSALGYDAVYLLKEAWEKAGSVDFKATVDALKSVERDGVTGHLVFGENNNPIKASSIIVIKDGKYKYYGSVMAD